MAVNLSPVGGVAAQFFTNNAVPLSGGKLFTYAAGTTTPQVAYTTSQGNIAWTNPIVLDAAGRVPSGGEIWLTDGIIYKFVLKDANDVLIATYDNISGINSNFVAFVNQQEIVTATAGQTVFNLGISYQPATNSLSVFVDGVNQYGPGAQYSYVETDSNTVTFNSGLHVGAEVKFTTTQQQGAGAVDAQQVTYDPPFTGSVITNVEAKLAQTVSVKDFGAVGDGITDDGPAIQAAIDYCGNANPVGAVPTLGYARATLVFPPGVYLTKQTLNFLPFINYIGTRATTVSAVANTANQSDSRGSIIRADVSIYNAGSNPTGCLVYISTGDIFIRSLQFVGTAQINGNPSTGIQFGSHGGVATTGRSYETDGTGQNTSGVNVEDCTFYTFSTAWECNMLNDAFMYQCRFESNTTSISFTQNVVAPINQSCEFIGCAIFGYAVGVGFDSGPAYTVTFNGGYFFGTSNSSQSVAYFGNAGSMNLKFNGVNFDHSGTGCAHFLMNGDYDGMFNRLLVTGCVFNGGAGRSKIQLSRGAGTAVYNHAIFSSCQYLATYFQLDLATKIQIKDSYFYDGYITMANATACDIAGNEFFAYNGTGITFSTADCAENTVRFNRFTNVTTPISVFDNPTNDSSVFQDNFGITAAPTRGKFIDYINNITFANLGTPANGSMVYCADGTIANPVAGGGTGCIAKRLNGVWVGN